MADDTDLPGCMLNKHRLIAEGGVTACKLMETCTTTSS